MRESEKRLAAFSSLAYIRDGMRVGLGTGSTVRYLLDELALRVRDGLDILGVPTSLETETLARSLGIPIRTLADLPELDLAIDGADQFDRHKNLIKGGHGALLREKVVAAAAQRFIVIVDSTKRASTLDLPVPVEVIPFAAPYVQSQLSKLHGEPTLRASFTTDQGNQIIDVDFGPIPDPEVLATRLSAIPGIAGHGLFCGMTDQILVAEGPEVHVIR